MKKLLLILSIIFYSFSSLYAEHKKADISDYIIAGGEIIYINGTIAVCDYAINNTNYALFNLDKIKPNFFADFVWDNSGFLRNQFAHPYFGSLYFNAARSNNISFLPSVLYTASGSFIWEFFIENGNISINDIITTTFAGAVTGEVLYRLGCEAEIYFSPLTWLINPFGSLNNFIRNQKFTATNLISSFDIFTGFGCSTYNVSFSESISDSKSYFQIPEFYTGINLTYGNPYGHNSTEFLDQFSLYFVAHLDERNKFFNYCIDGNLYSYALNFQNETSSSIGFSYNYDFLYSSDIFYSNNSAGIFYNLYVPFEKNSSLSFDTQVNYSILNTLDNYFINNHDTKVNFATNQLNYTYNNGPELKLKLTFENPSAGNFFIKEKTLFVFPWNGSISDLRKNGLFILNDLSFNYEHQLVNNFYLGMEDRMILKNSLFSECENVNQIMNYFNLYVKYKIK